MTDLAEDLQIACADARRLYQHFNDGYPSVNLQLDAKRISHWIELMEISAQTIDELVDISHQNQRNADLAIKNTVRSIENTQRATDKFEAVDSLMRKAQADHEACEQKRAKMYETLERVRKFIVDEYRDPSREPAGDWIAPEARHIYDDIVDALHEQE